MPKSNSPLLFLTPISGILDTYDEPKAILIVTAPFPLGRVLAFPKSCSADAFSAF
jgi:hypothetical protein